MDNQSKYFKIERAIEYVFANKELLLCALTHSSYINENKMGNYDHNERLEFLGDATLELVISEYLYIHFPHQPEGELTKMRANIVCTDSLAESAINLQLGKMMKMGKGEIMSGGRSRKSILADTMEAIIGAVYLDGGLEEAKKFIFNQLRTMIKAVEKGNMNRDYKTLLQEIVQRKKEQVLQYHLIREQGPDHNKVFCVEVLLNGKMIGIGEGHNKKEAEQEAAKQALKIINKEN